MGSPAIFAGSLVKLLKNNLKFGVNTTIFTGSANPATSATTGAVGDCYISNHATAFGIYVKKDAGSSTNWTKANLVIQDEGSDLASAHKLNFVGAGVSVASDGTTYTVTISGGGGGGGGGGGSSDRLRNVTAAELSNDAEFENENEFINDYEEVNKGTHPDMTVSQSGLRFNTGISTATDLRDRASNVSRDSVSGIVTYAIRHLAPKAVAPANPSAATVTYEFQGNVVNYFPNAEKVVFLRMYLEGDTNADGKSFGIPLLTSSNKPAILTVNALPVYNSALDKTPVVFTNASTLDTDFDLSAADYPTKLRIVPFEYLVKANTANASPTSGQYEDVDLINLYTLDAIALQGEAFLSEITDVSIDGRILKFDIEVSDNGIYRVFRLVEDDSVNETWRFFGQVGSNTPVYLGSKSYNFSGLGEELGGEFYYNNRSHLAIADNGKGIALYNIITGGNNETRAVTFNLTDVTPVIADIVTNGAGAGTIRTGLANGGQIAYDRTDLSFAMILSRNTASNTYRMFAYTSGGTVYDSTSSNTADTAVYNELSGNNPPTDMVVSGTGTSHRTHFFYTDSGSFDVRGVYLSQGSSTISSYNGGADISTGGTTGSPAYVTSVIATATKGVVTYSNLVSSNYQDAFRYFDLTGGAPSISAANIINSVGSNGYQTHSLFYGYSSGSHASTHRLLRQCCVSNPSDGNHIMFTKDLTQPDNGVTSMSYEVKDITAYQGVHSSSYTFDTTSALNGSAGGQQRAQTFTTAASAKRVRTVAFKIYQGGTIASGNTITCRLYATSSGVPTGAALYTASNTINPSLVTTSTAGQWVFFNFDSVSLSNSTMYAAVLSVSYATDATNRILVMGNSTDVFAGGSRCDFDGSTWTAAGGDLIIEIIGDWTKDNAFGFSNGDSAGQFSNERLNCEESSVGKITTTSVQHLFRRCTGVTSANTLLPRIGYPMRAVMTWSTGAVQSSWTSAANGAYAAASFDQFNVFNISYGDPSSARFNNNTEAQTAISAYEESGPFRHPISTGNFSGLTEDADANFQSGRCFTFNGTTNRLNYTNSDVLDLYFNKPYCMEFEIKPTSVAVGTKVIFSTTLAATDAAGFYAYIGDTSSGDLVIKIKNSAGANIAVARTNGAFVAAGTYNAIRITGDGAGGAPKIFKATTYNGTYTEATYATTTAFSSGNTTGTGTGLNVAAFSDNTLFYPGKIGYLKINNGSSTFVYSGYLNITSVTNIQNGGTAIYGKKMKGENGSGTNFAEFMQSKQNSALVDSRPLVGEYTQSLAATGRYMHLKISATRPNTSDDSYLENYDFDFTQE